MKRLHKFDCLKLSIGQPCTDTTVKFVEVKIKEFAAMYSYDCTYNSGDLRFCLKPNNRFPQARNSFRPAINVWIDQDKDSHTGILISLSLPHPARIVIAIMYVLLFIFGGTLFSFWLMDSLDPAGIAACSGLFVFSTLFVCLGRYTTFKHVFLALQGLFAQGNSKVDLGQ